VPCHHPACTYHPAQCCHPAQCRQINHCQSTGPMGFPLQVFPFYFYFCQSTGPHRFPQGFSFFFLQARRCLHKHQHSGPLFLFTSSPLPPQTPTLWPTQVPSWVSFFFYCIIGLTSMLLPQGCVDPLVSGDGQTVSYQPHNHANTIRSSREQRRSSHNL
jgi:hypothetical protein